MERKFEFSEGEYYHVYNRGVDKRLIFTGDYDHKRFIALLFLCNSEKPVDFSVTGKLPWDLIDRGETIVDIGAYCLMPNHFHLLLKEKKEGGISRFMAKTLTAYSKYFNKMNDRKGRLFESTFKAKHADTDEYLKYLFAYIHLNPVKMIDPTWKEKGLISREKTKSYLSQYKFSSHSDYLNRPRSESMIIKKESFPEYFNQPGEFIEYLENWLNLEPEENSEKF